MKIFLKEWRGEVEGVNLSAVVRFEVSNFDGGKGYGLYAILVEGGYGGVLLKTLPTTPELWGWLREILGSPDVFVGESPEEVERLLQKSCPPNPPFSVCLPD